MPGLPTEVRCHIKQKKDKMQFWHAIPWQYCMTCGLVLQEQFSIINAFSRKVTVSSSPDLVF